MLAAQSLPLRVASPRHDRPAGRLSQATRTVVTGPYSISRVNLDARLEGWFDQRAGECRCVKRNQVENWASQSVSGQGSSSVKWLMQLAWMTVMIMGVLQREREAQRCDLGGGLGRAR
jgi:hypothetical protein